MWVQRSVSTIAVHSYNQALWVPLTPMQMSSRMTSPSALATSLLRAVPTLVFFLSLRQELDPQGPGGTGWISGCHFPLTIFPKNPGLPSKNYLDLIFDLVLFIKSNKEIREANAWPRQTPRSFLHFLVSLRISWCLLQTCHQILANTGQGKQLRNSGVHITGYLYCSVLTFFPCSYSSMTNWKARKMASKALPYS